MVWPCPSTFPQIVGLLHQLNAPSFLLGTSGDPRTLFIVMPLLAPRHVQGDDTVDYAKQPPLSPPSCSKFPTAAYSGVADLHFGCCPTFWTISILPTSTTLPQAEGLLMSRVATLSVGVLPRLLLVRGTRGGPLWCRWATTSAPGAPANKDQKKAFSATLHLPKTNLPLRLKDVPKHEAKFRDRTTHELYRKQVSTSASSYLRSSMTTMKARFLFYMTALRMRMETCIWVGNGT